MMKAVFGLFAALFMVATTSTTANSTEYRDTVNDQFLAQLNHYTKTAHRLIVYGRLFFENPSRTGPDVTIRGRGPLITIAGAQFYRASMVVVGHPCDDCIATWTRYDIDSDVLDDFIVVYSEP